MIISMLAREEENIHLESHLRKEKPSKRYFDQNTLVKCFPQDATDESVPVEAVCWTPERKNHNCKHSGLYAVLTEDLPSVA